MVRLTEHEGQPSVDHDEAQREELESIASRRSTPVGHVTRARIVLLSVDGVSGAEIAARLGVTQEHVEGFFGILTKQSLSFTNFLSKKALRDHIEAYIAGWNSNPTPFVWTKPAAAIIRSHAKCLTASQVRCTSHA